MEDKSSLVLGTGRPFFVKLNHPNKRTSKLTSIDLGSIKIKNLKIIDKFPQKPILFSSSIEIKISSKSTIDSQYLKKLKNICNSPVVVCETSGKRFEKQIFSLSLQKTLFAHFFSIYES